MTTKAPHEPNVAMPAEPQALIPLSRAKAENAIGETKRVNTRFDKLQDVTVKQIEELAKRYSRERSSFLFAIIGGGVGGGGSFASLTAAHGLGTLVLAGGPIGAAVGAALAVLAWRGLSYLKLERKTEEVEISLNHYRSQIISLPNDVPAYVKENLWQRYDEMSARYARIAMKTFENHDSSAMETGRPTRTIDVDPS